MRRRQHGDASRVRCACTTPGSRRTCRPAWPGQQCSRDDKRYRHLAQLGSIAGRSTSDKAFLHLGPWMQRATSPNHGLMVPDAFRRSGDLARSGVHPVATLMAPGRTGFSEFRIPPTTSCERHSLRLGLPTQLRQPRHLSTRGHRPIGRRTRRAPSCPPCRLRSPTGIVAWWPSSWEPFWAYSLW